MLASRARPAVVATVLALASLPATAGAATPITIGEGAKPGVAVDAAGTAYVAWYGPEPSITTLRFCRLPRGATNCASASNISAPGTAISRPFVAVSGSTVVVVHYRYGLTGPRFDQVYSFVSNNGGQSFANQGPIGITPFDESVAGPGNTVSVATNAVTQGLFFQNMPLSGGGAGSARATLSTTHPYNGTVGLVDAATPLVAFSNGASLTQFRRYTGSGSLNDASNWTPPVDIGYADYPRLAGGPSGLFMMAGTETGALVARKYDGATFGRAATIIANGGDDAQQHLFQDPAGRLHAVFPRRDARGLHLGHAVSDNGRAWTRHDLLTVPVGESIDALRVATAPDHVGFAVWHTSTSSGARLVRAVRLGPGAGKPNGRLPARRKPPATAKRLKNGAVRFAIKGKLSRPAGVARAQACRGRIAVTVKRGKRAIYRKTLKVNRKCGFRRATRLKRRKVKRARRLTMTLRFRGNEAVGAAKRTYRVKVK